MAGCKLGAPRGALSYRRFGDKQRSGLLIDGNCVWSPDFLLWECGLGPYLGIGAADGREGAREVIEM